MRLLQTFRYWIISYLEIQSFIGKRLRDDVAHIALWYRGNSHCMRKLCVLERAASSVQRTWFRFAVHLKVKFPPWEFNIATWHGGVVLAHRGRVCTYMFAHPRACPRVAFRCVRRVRRAVLRFGALPSIRLDMQIIRRKNRPGMRQRRYN